MIRRASAPAVVGEPHTAQLMIFLLVRSTDEFKSCLNGRSITPPIVDLQRTVKQAPCVSLMGLAEVAAHLPRVFTQSNSLMRLNGFIKYAFG